MEVLNSAVTLTGDSYFGIHYPPAAYNASTTWSTNDFLLKPLQPPDDAFQMQHLKFPTPPSTPPRCHHQVAVVAVPQIDLTTKYSHSSSSSQKRTQSVIMKINQGQHSPQHVSTTDICALDDDVKLINHDVEATSSEERSSSSPSSDYVCDWVECGRYFSSLCSLATHVTQVHAVASLADGLYYCRWSGCLRTERGFNARYKMLVHVRTHTKEKPHQCHLCEKNFSRAENLKIHIRSHSGEKPYICTYEGCTKAYSNSSDRFKHTRTHSMEKPYMCKVPGCQKRYTDPSSLRKHVKTFKHTVQMLETAACSPRLPIQASTTPCRRCVGYESSQDDRAPMYLCLLHSQPAHHYYMGVVTDSSEDDFHLNASQLDYYEADAQGSGSVWLTNAINVCSTPTESLYPLPRTEYSMDVEPEPELPLDLRLNRSR